MHWSQVIFHQGNEELKRFIEVGFMALRLGVPLHFHVEGVRGTGKTTMIRAAKSCFPHIAKVAGCPYNCDPEQPHCPQHRGEVNLNVESCTAPFLEVSHSAKVGTVVGSIDLEKLTSLDSPAAALLPGTVPRANRGVVFVDEINRLADTSPALVDVLLDVMGTKPGRIQIEETGLHTVEMPVNVSVWAASNPDEEPGPLQEIRRQLADRFDFVVRIERPQEAATVRAIMLAAAGADNIQTPALTVAEGLEAVEMDERLDDFLGNMYVRFRLESIRGVQATRLGTQLYALAQGKNRADFADMAAILPAALRHRLESPRLAEILEAVKTSTAGQRREHQQTVKCRETRDNPSYRYPALWRGLWQRLSGGQSQKQGKTASVSDNFNSENKEEKKTIAASQGVAESDRQQL